MISFKGAHFPKDIILMGVRWYVAYPLSYRHVEELMEERGVPVDHATIQRWVVKYSPLLEAALHRRKRPVWVSWRMDETYIKVKGQWYYLCRAVDKHGQTIDFLLTKQRDEEAALRFLKKAIGRHEVPDKITIDGSAANEAAIKRYNKEHGTAIIIRQVKYLTNVVEQDHRGVKRVTRPMLGFKSFDAAQSTLVGIELMHMIKKTTGGDGSGGRRPYCRRTVLRSRRLITPPDHVGTSQIVSTPKFATEPTGPKALTWTNPSASRRVSPVVGTEPGFAICSRRAARWVVWPTAV